ncbi:uncharacterized protein LOC113294688 [Papaver somniferum]|uniref:uncharacterized protein LOC113294688 n=1 Tax=Papaver somniferum TaxID=3469 RepID=UPI000E705C7A|nr:uncharacterized protein LOC113294688 [Papaver somniferum]
MPFGLKNDGATYKRAMTAIFHDMMQKQVKDYVDDIVVKSKTRATHTDVLRQVFERCHEYKLKMNPLKCAFGVSSGKFLGFQVTSEGIKVDPTKTQAILTMPPPQTMKELQSFMGKVNYIQHFIPDLAQLIAAFTPLLKKGASFIWSTKQQEAFRQIQQILSSPTVMKYPTQGRALCLYTSSSDTDVGPLPAQEDDEGIEHPIYYFTRTLRDVELRYPKAEKAFLALVHVVQKFRHYLLSNKVVSISRVDPIKFLLSKPALIGRPAKWLLQTSEFDITCDPPRSIKGQVVADLLAVFPGEGTTTLHEDLPGEFPEISFIEKEARLLYFDGSATPRNNTGGAGIVLVSPTGEVFSHSFKLDFQCTNNSAEYEAFLIGLSVAKQEGATHLEIRGDSKLLVNQMNGVYSLKALAPYRSEAQRLLNYFVDATITHIGCNNNKHVDCLATLASKLQFEGLEETLIVKRRIVASTWLAQSKDVETDDWRTPIVQELNSSLSQGKVGLKTLQSFFMLHGVLYHRNPDESLSRCLGDEEAQLQLNRIHNEACGQTLVVTLYRRLQRLGFYWPKMETQSRSLQGSCSDCQIPPHQLEVSNVSHTGDWREPYINYLRDRVLPASKKDASKMKQRAKRFVFHEGILYRKSFGGDLLRCLTEVEIPTLMKEIHAGEHQGKKKLFLQIYEKYYWPTMEDDAASFVQICKECQIHGNIIHTPSTPLHSVSSLWPFYSWGLDIIGKINLPSSKQPEYIITATENFTKWVESIPLRGTNGATIAALIKKHTICRFGVPKHIVTDNGTPFANKQVQELLEEYGIKQVFSTIYYPQGNGHAESTNKT